MSGIGRRIKIERERLGLSQPSLADIVDASKRTIIEWEKGSTSPNAVQLSALSSIGGDPLFIITGNRADSSLSNYLTSSEAELIKAYRNTDQAHQDTVLQVCDALASKYEVEYAPSNTSAFSSEDDHMISQRLRIERERVGLTPEQLIEKNMMGIDMDNYIATEHNEINPIKDWTGLEFAALAALGMDVRYILIGERSLIVPDRLVSTEK